jgi:hypothetical protein
MSEGVGEQIGEHLAQAGVVADHGSVSSMSAEPEGCGPSMPRSPTTLARPQSTTSVSPYDPNITLESLMSRWRMPRPWAYSIVRPYIARRLPATFTCKATGAGTAVHHFGDYELVGEIYPGVMGMVDRARQVALNRIVARKMILSAQLASVQEVRRFRIEDEAAANFDHPGIDPSMR